MKKMMNSNCEFGCRMVLDGLEMIGEVLAPLGINQRQVLWHKTKIGGRTIRNVMVFHVSGLKQRQPRPPRGPSRTATGPRASLPDLGGRRGGRPDRPWNRPSAPSLVAVWMAVQNTAQSLFVAGGLWGGPGNRPVDRQPLHVDYFIFIVPWLCLCWVYVVYAHWSCLGTRV